MIGVFKVPSSLVGTDDKRRKLSLVMSVKKNAVSFAVL
jgi:hypothetical protein